MSSKRIFLFFKKKVPVLDIKNSDNKKPSIATKANSEQTTAIE